MIFRETSLKGAFVVELEKLIDERGYFARSFCRNEFNAYGLNPEVVQCNISFNKKKGTLRGLHWQAEPFSEAKTVRCISGAIYDVIIDLRPESKTFMQWFSLEICESIQKFLYIPEGFAHGFLTLADNTEIFYQMSDIYQPNAAQGLRYNDPAFGIKWPEKIKNISSKDLGYADFQPEELEGN